MAMHACAPLFFAVTGAQGVGKSTFCRRLVDAIGNKRSVAVSLLCGLGDSVRARGVPVGAGSNSDTIFAIYEEHLKREREADAHVVILDRCVVDALAYTRVLRLTSDSQNALLDEVVRFAVKRLSLVVALELSSTFASTNATHETPEMRNSVAMEIPSIIEELGIPSISLDASNADALEIAQTAILQHIPR